MEQMQQKRTLGKLVSIVLLIGIIAGSVFSFTHKRQILDYIALRNYQPSQQVQSLASDTTMRDSTRNLFYVNHPQLNDKNSFKNNCPSTEQSIVLGCYVQNKGIFLLNVEDSRLQGVVQVTAAHETLHAEYDRLSDADRKHVDQMTSTFFASLQNDRIKKTIEQYRTKDPSVVPNELHSILGTEVKDLSPELEQYYTRYFNDRSKIVDFSEKYEQTFVGLNDEVDNYDTQLKSMKETIDSNQLKIDAMGADVERRKSQLDSLITSDTRAYNDAVPGFNAQVQEYNSLITTTRDLISQYNDAVAKRNSIVTTEQQLVEAIDSNKITPKETE